MGFRTVIDFCERWLGRLHLGSWFYEKWREITGAAVTIVGIALEWWDQIRQYDPGWIIVILAAAFALVMGGLNQGLRIFDRWRRSSRAGAEPDKIPLIELREMAAEAGWITDNRTSNDTFHLVNKLNQAASDGVIKFWGRKYQDRYLAEGAAESIPLDEIPVKHFKDGYLFDIFSIFGDDATNFYIHTGKLGKHMRDQVGEIYCDIYADRQQLVNWISRNKSA